MGSNVFARLGAVLYILWGLLHYSAAYTIYLVGLALPPGMAQGRLFQCAFYILAFATSGIIVAVRLNWRNSRAGFWLNAVQIGIADVPFIVFVIVPGYAPLWPGLVGPALWIAAVIMTGLDQMHRSERIHASA